MQTVSEPFSKTMSVLSKLFSLDATPQHKRNCAIEGVRGFAILLVFLCHYADIVVPRFKLPLVWQAAAADLSALGRSGVALFFVLSGYLIYRTVVRRNFNLAEFWGRRVQRIYPAFLVVFSIYLAMWLMQAGSDKTGEQLGARIPHDAGAAWGYLLANLLFLPGIFPIKPLMNVAWSLSYEWFFYLIIPIVAVALGRLTKPLRLWLLAAVCAFYLLLSLWQPNVSSFAMAAVIHFVAAHNGLVMFVGGMIVYEVTQQPRSAGKLEWVALAVILALLTVLFMRATGAAPAAFVAYGLLLYFAVIGGGSIAQLLSFKPLRALGNISYSFYLIHGLPIHISAGLASRIGGGVVSSFLFLPLCLLFTTSVSLALFVLIERPLSLRSESSSKSAVHPRAGSAVPRYVE